MTEKQYRLNKWGTRLLKNNRPLFDWTNESDEIVDLLNKLNDENKQLKHKFSQQEMEYATTAYRQAEKNEQLKIRFNEEREKSLKFCRNIDTLTIENKQLKYQNELLSDELEQCKVVIDNKWSEYLKKKELL